MQGKPVIIDLEQLRKLYINEKKSFTTCAKILGCSQSVIRNRLKIMNIKSRKNYEWSIGCKLSEYQIECIRKSHLGKHHTEEAKKKISERGKGRHHTEESKRKMSIAKTGKKSNVYQDGESNPNWNGGFSESWFNDPVISACYWQVKKAKKLGELIKKPCEVCGDKKVVGHHDDYRKPLSIRWLCRKHHMQFHRVHKLEDYKYIEFIWRNE